MTWSDGRDLGDRLRFGKTSVAVELLGTALSPAAQILSGLNIPRERIGEPRRTQEVRKNIGSAPQMAAALVRAGVTCVEMGLLKATTVRTAAALTQ